MNLQVIFRSYFLGILQLKIRQYCIVKSLASKSDRLRLDYWFCLSLTLRFQDLINFGSLFSHNRHSVKGTDPVNV